MINRSIFTAIILIFFTPEAANAADIHNKHKNRSELYNKVVSLYFFSKNIIRTDDQPTYFIFGFKRKNQINSHLIKCNQWRYHLLDDYLEDVSRLQKNDEGHLVNNSIKVGNYSAFHRNHNYSTLHDSLNCIDVSQISNRITACKRKKFSDHGNIVENYRDNNLFSLVNELNLDVQYLKNKKIKRCNINTDLSEIFSSRRTHYFERSGFDAFIDYKFNDFSIMGSYSFINDKNVKQGFYSSSFGNSSRFKQWTASLKYNTKNTYLEAVYKKITSNASPICINNKNEMQNILLVAQYQFNFGFRPSITFLKLKERYTELNDNRNLKKYFLIRATYYFNKSTSAYIDYKISQTEKNEKSSTDLDSITVAISIVY